MSAFQQVVIALLVIILARTYRPPLGDDSTSNTVAIAIPQLVCLGWIGWTVTGV